jgi:outer membrane protein OmpA-like peptidoglycan-associated protein
MRGWAVACLTGVLFVSGCDSFQRKKDPLDDPKVTARCTPVKALLSKNVRSSGSANMKLLFSVGGLYDRSGAVLDAAEASRVARIDAVCRAWVNNAVTDQEYGKFLMATASATIVQTTTAADRQGVVEAVVKYLDDLPRSGLPEGFDPKALPAQVTSDLTLSQQQLEANLRKSEAALKAKISTIDTSAEAYQAEVRSRLDSIDGRLLKLETKSAAIAPASAPPGSASAPSSTSTKPQPPSYSASAPGAGIVDRHTSAGETTVVKAPAVADVRELDVYFASGSAELAFSERRLIEVAAFGWSRTGATIFVMGYADPRGSPTYNKRLSLARAHAVADLLRQRNVKVGAANGAGAEAGSDNDALRRVHLLRVDM